jgi:membrane protein implicated in regulation of membrane protease activity
MMLHHREAMPMLATSAISIGLVIGLVLCIRLSVILLTRTFAAVIVGASYFVFWALVGPDNQLVIFWVFTIIFTAAILELSWPLRRGVSDNNPGDA